MSRVSTFRDIRTEKLRNLGGLNARRTFAYSKEALRRARIAYNRLRVEPDYRIAVHRRIRDRWVTLVPACCLVVAITAFFAAQGTSFLAGGATLGAIVVGLWVVYSVKNRRTPDTRNDDTDAARQFAAFFASRAPRLPVAAREALQGLGGDLSTLVAELAEGAERSPLSVDERRFVRVIVIEHLVNAVDPYLALRHPGALHESLVASQIVHIHAEVLALLAKFEAARVQHLARSAKFLERKLGS